jgi:hypothetical protein
LPNGPKSRPHRQGIYKDAATPSSHFVEPPTQRIPWNPTPARSTSADPSLSGTRCPVPDKPDFRARQPLFQLVNPPLEAQGILDQFHGPLSTGSRKPVLQHANGESSLICFQSSAAAPFSVCNTANCLRAQRSRSCPRNNSGRFNAFSHVDFNDPCWASQPKTFWAPV